MAAKSEINLDSMTAQELTALIEQAKAALIGKRDSARTELVTEMRAKAEALGLDLSSLLTTPRTNVRKPRSDKGGSLVVKYRGPGGETWSGRGRKPTWLTASEAQGKAKEEFLVG